MSDCIARDVLDHAERTPDAPALWWRESTVSYAALAELTRRAGAALTAAGLHRDAPIALRAVKSPASIAMTLACFRARRPVFLVSPDLGREVLATLLLRSGCQAEATADEADGGGTFALHPPATAEYSATPAPADPAAEPAESAESTAKAAPPLPSGTGLLLTTSGSTGIPKIVPLGREALGRFTDWAMGTFGLGPGTTVLNYAPLNFDLCLLDIWATLRGGGRVVPVAPDLATNPHQLERLLRRTRPQVVQAVPMFFRLLVQAASGGDPVPGVRHVLLTGEHTPRGLRAQLAPLFPEAVFHNVYGCTETNDSLVHSFPAAEAAERETLPLGRPLPGVTVQLRDGERTVEGPGTGELMVTTPFQSTGYLGAAGTEDRFVPVATDTGERVWYRTGDLVRRGTDGELTLVGRNDFQVKVAGVRVNLEQIETVILSHPKVLDAVVVPLPDPLAGTRLCAVVRTAPDSDLTSLRLLGHCSAGLARAALPTFRLTREPLPTGPTGKADRARIKEELLKDPALT
ncbi:AMP-binding protein [Streptomyces sp. NA02950]|uniref:AMP-binding protein n=1 Tax=Streptomyces sp. NA02950 TaxID=2742137 RepID=UPI00159052CC|nr:AMP-binding protein [Streptomyces sp. NA02950]QKV91479.1 AMP-binding protein [Streptomyces sp. NA02950]